MRALCLAVGGSKGAYEMGVLRKWMHEDGTDYDVLCGMVDTLDFSPASIQKMATPAK